MILSVLFSKPARYAWMFILVFLLGVGTDRLWLRHNPVAPTVITKRVDVPGAATVVTVAGPITTKTLTKIVQIKDTAEAEALLNQNKVLGDTVTQLNETVAQLKVQGAGALTVITKDPEPIAFKDFRLDFKSDGRTANYSLAQNFEVLSTSGRMKDGKPFTTLKMFEVTPTGKNELQAQTTSVTVDDTQSHWIVSPAIQAGVTLGKTKGGLVGLQWLKRGRTKAAEDSTLAIATPVVGFGSQTEIGVLPISINLGQIKHQPLKDFWASPYIGTSNPATKTIDTFGFALTTTF